MLDRISITQDKINTEKGPEELRRMLIATTMLLAKESEQKNKVIGLLEEIFTKQMGLYYASPRVQEEWNEFAKRNKLFEY